MAKYVMIKSAQDKISALMNENDFEVISKKTLDDYVQNLESPEKILFQQSIEMFGFGVNVNSLKNNDFDIIMKYPVTGETRLMLEDMYQGTTWLNNVTEILEQKQ